MIKFPVTVIYLSSMRTWSAPYEKETISEAELETIKQHIREGLRFLGAGRVLFE